MQNQKMKKPTHFDQPIVVDEIERSKLADLYGIGVGSGAPELITIRALSILRSVDHLFIPRSSQYVPSVAWRTVHKYLDNSRQKKTELFFPMTKDPQIIIPAWQKIIDQFEQALGRNEKSAFITQGDPLFYSTFNYIFEKISEKFPDRNIEIVPAISSITAGAAVAKIPLVDGQEKMAIIPASYGLQSLAQILQLFDTILLLKVSRVLPEIIKILTKEKFLDRAIYIRRATMLEGEQVIRYLPDALSDRCDYFSLILIKKYLNDKILFGKKNKRI